MVVRHEFTKTSRTVRAIEDGLRIELNKIVNIIKKQDTILSELQRKYGEIVRSTIQDAIQQIYLAGINYVGDYEKRPPLLNDRDIAIIERQTEQRTNDFWRAVERDIARNTNNKFALISPNFSALSPLNVNAQVLTVATVAATSALNVATVEKAKQMDAEAVVMWVITFDERTCPKCRPLHGRKWSVNDPNLLVPIQDTHPHCRCRLLFVDNGKPFSH